MKILYHHRTASRDGQAVHIEELISALRDQGHEVAVVGPRLEVQGGFGGESRLVRRLKSCLPKAAFQLLELIYSIVAYRALDRACRRQRPDVLYERYNLHLLAAVWLRRRWKLPYFLEVNAPLYEERARHDGLSLHALARWSERTAWRAADVVLPVTGVLADHVKAAGVPSSRIVVMPNGIDLARFGQVGSRNRVRASFGLRNALVLGFVGFIRSWHGLHKVIEVLADPALTAAHLLVVGDGPGREVLEHHAKQLGVTSSVTVTGVVDRERIGELVAAFDVALQPSATPYASPLKLFEYMASGCAIIAPRQPNIEEVLTHEHSAILFDPQDDDDFRAALTRLCCDADLRGRLGEGARAAIGEKQLTWANNARRLTALFETAVSAEVAGGRASQRLSYSK